MHSRTLGTRALARAPGRRDGDLRSWRPRGGAAQSDRTRPGRGRPAARQQRRPASSVPASASARPRAGCRRPPRQSASPTPSPPGAAPCRRPRCRPGPARARTAPARASRCPMRASLPRRSGGGREDGRTSGDSRCAGNAAAACAAAAGAAVCADGCVRWAPRPPPALCTRVRFGER